MGHNMYARRGKAQLTREFVTVADNAVSVLNADQASAEIIVPGTATITNNLPGGVTVNAGNTTLQFPNTPGDGSDGMYWWIDLRQITISANGVVIAGTASGVTTPTTGFTVSSVPSNKGVLCYWTGTDMVRLA